MDKKIHWARAMQILFLYVIAILFLLAWPCRVIRQNIISGDKDTYLEDSEVVYEDVELVHQFKPQYKNLESLSFYISNELEEDEYLSFDFYFFDQEQNLIMNQQITLDGADYPGFCEVPLDLLVDTEKNYTYLLNSPFSPLTVGVTDLETSRAVENDITYIGNQVQESVSVLTKYHYKIPFSGGILFVFLLIGALVIAGIEFLGKKIEGKKEFSQNTVIKLGANIVVGIALIALMIALWPLKLFGTNTLDIVVYEISCLLLGGTALWYINKLWTPTANLENFFKREKAADYLQTLFFGAAFCHACNYVNATYQYIHEINSRKIIAYIGLATLCMVAKKQFWNIRTLILVLVAALFGVVNAYYKIGQGMNPELVTWENLIIIVWINLLFQAIRVLLMKRVKKISWSYAGIMVLFWALLLLFQNGRRWVWMVIIPFAFFYLLYHTKENKRNTLVNVMNGILFSFVVITIYCLLHRPFHYYIYTRYPWYFHTVTITAMYFVLVFAAALTKVWIAYAKKDKQAIAGSIILFGAVSAYILMTISRTAIFSAPVLFCGVVFLKWLKNRKNWKKLLKQAGVMVIVSILSFPVFFMLTRTIPAIINLPKQTEIEVFLDSIVEGDPLDSRRYITIEQFFGLSSERLSIFKEEEKEEEEDLPSLSANQIALSANQVADEQSAIKEEKDLEKESEEESKEEPGALHAYSNGRVDIWKAYLKVLNVKGHDGMSINVNGTDVTHAHNSFLQLAYDTGILTGIVFLLLYVFSLIRAIYIYIISKKRATRALLPIMLIGAFGLVSLIEWAFHPCIPIGLAFLLINAPLFQRIERNEKE